MLSKKSFKAIFFACKYLRVTQVEFEKIFDTQEKRASFWDKFSKYEKLYERDNKLKEKIECSEIFLKFFSPDAIDKDAPKKENLLFLLRFVKDYLEIFDSIEEYFLCTKGCFDHSKITDVARIVDHDLKTFGKDLYDILGSYKDNYTVYLAFSTSPFKHCSISEIIKDSPYTFIQTIGKLRECADLFKIFDKKLWPYIMSYKPDDTFGENKKLFQKFYEGELEKNDGNVFIAKLKAYLHDIIVNWPSHGVTYENIAEKYPELQKKYDLPTKTPIRGGGMRKALDDDGPNAKKPANEVFGSRNASALYRTDLDLFGGDV